MRLSTLAAGAILVLGLTTAAYAGNDAQTELEHAIKTPSSTEGPTEDMSKMKAAGKCNADQSAKMKVKATKPARKPTKAELELEHANKLQTEAGASAGNMKNMKAQGKCNTGK